MKKDLLNQLKDFEIFVERLEKFVNDVKTDDTLKNLDLDFNNYDLRDRNGNVFLLPFYLEDYFEIWKHVKECYQRFLDSDDATIERYGYDYEFFDLYWDCKEDKSAYYQDETFCVDFDKNKGIYFKN